MKRFKKQKREKFAWILTKSLAVALALSCVFAVGFQTYMYEIELVTLADEHFTFIANARFTIGKEVEEHDT